ncbi:hypothetical protein D9758_011954 [Tetrapyrgos nigripes]|uniref:Uncharacterized protein n=1 Tax=Tetrapyrgos nigripes TaxID=182062 RepID=A0A8H5FXE6_9AGAR|nr:hypothetical protein D9758_011954 [Tetrapyrgos nigripes]
MSSYYELTSKDGGKNRKADGFNAFDAGDVLYIPGLIPVSKESLEEAVDASWICPRRTVPIIAFGTFAVPTQEDHHYFKYAVPSSAEAKEWVCEADVWDDNAMSIGDRDQEFKNSVGPERVLVAASWIPFGGRGRREGGRDRGTRTRTSGGGAAAAAAAGVGVYKDGYGNGAIGRRRRRSSVLWEWDGTGTTGADAEAGSWTLGLETGLGTGIGSGSGMGTGSEYDYECVLVGDTAAGEFNLKVDVRFLFTMRICYITPRSFDPISLYTQIMHCSGRDHVKLHRVGGCHGLAWVTIALPVPMQQLQTVTVLAHRK